MGGFDFIVQTAGSLLPLGEPTDYLSEYTALIHYSQDEKGKTVRAGKMHAWRIHVDLAWANGESVFDVCDAHSQELH